MIPEGGHHASEVGARGFVLLEIVKEDRAECFGVVSQSLVSRGSLYWLLARNEGRLTPQGLQWMKPHRTS